MHKTVFSSDRKPLQVLLDALTCTEHGGRFGKQRHPFVSTPESLQHPLIGGFQLLGTYRE